MERGKLVYEYGKKCCIILYALYNTSNTKQREQLNIAKEVKPNLIIRLGCIFFYRNKQNHYFFTEEKK